MTPNALMELAEKLDAWARDCEDLDDPHSNVPGVFLSNLITGDFYDTLKAAATQLRAAAEQAVVSTPVEATDVVSTDAADSGNYMCPNCNTPWKCNGPHIPQAPPTSPSAERDDQRMKLAIAAYTEIAPSGVNTRGLRAAIEAATGGAK